MRSDDGWRKRISMNIKTGSGMRTWLMILVCTGAVQVHAQTAEVLVKNPAAFDRQHETIAVPLGMVRELLGPGDAAMLHVRYARAKETLPIQVTASDVLFQCDVLAKDSVTCILGYTPQREVPHPSVVSGLFAVPREDYAWENDRIAFRMYGPAMAADVNNGIDVWTKRVHYPIVYKWYKEAEGSAPGKDSYHQDRGEGADYFSVGRSLGAGGSGLWSKGAVLQPGVFRSWKTLTNGPVRIAFMLTYVWHLGLDTLVEERTISLDAGENLNRIEVRYVGNNGNVPVAAGLVKRANTVPSRDEKQGILSLWGPTVADPLSGELGTAVVLPRSVFTGFAEDKDQYLSLGEAGSGTPFVYYAGAGWTGNGILTGSNDWSAYLSAFAQRLAIPLSVTVTRGK
jgi:unsaturated rhamnogalacturonyl hydrolase